MKNPWINKKYEIKEVAPDIEPEITFDKVSGKAPHLPNIIGAFGIPSISFTAPPPFKIETHAIKNELSIFDSKGKMTCTTFQTLETMNACDDIKIDPLQKLNDKKHIELDPDPIIYSREFNAGPFTFKDAGELGVDIFHDGVKLGWLNANGEQNLKGWLNSKPPQIEETEINFLSDKHWLPEKSELKKFLDKNKPYREMDGYNTKIVSNQVIFGGGWVGEKYHFGHKNIVPGSIIFTSYIDGNESWINRGECVSERGSLPTYRSDSLKTSECYNGKDVIVDVVMNYEEGAMTVVWSGDVPKNSLLLVCYEYAVQRSYFDKDKIYKRQR